MQVRRLLFLQKADVLEQQKAWVVAQLGAALPQASIEFAGSAEAVPEGAVFDVVIAPTLPWLPQALGRLTDYRWVHFLSAGVEKIWAMDFDKTRPIMTKSSGVHGAPMSEYAIGAMLYFTKQFGRFHQQARHAEWQHLWLDGLTGKQLTVLGLGHVGQSLARRAKAFDMQVAGTLRNLRPVEQVDRVVSLAEIESELARTDFLICCLPLTEETRGLVNDELLGRLKPGAVLIDISRGGVVKGDAVLKALNAGTLKGAALDVFEQQPLPKDSPLWQREDVLITPHVAGTTPHYLKRALDVFLQSLHDQMAGRPISNQIDVKAGY
ncbi:D-2-hydroxyacid dehydrogenase [Halomonas campisalis]|uniref:D-2-hydroxyacid dehydrogenase n=1 Tax=Billgrantia campisalis TaxID=74661 RepID=A0ABS9P3F8_9GAMM|nr:D-2-hydroxyacid dehydrogenase [Halomonas campisalis]MCG6656328.1 D-2-hydroxyacid dehydrogenase [Halomonas campisalis]MDR5861514.1 D-2-hydroxyacid dehydrogenase [Halomonas campisalis]